jgi:hypothetical protein
VTTRESEELWIIQPLLDAGLELDEVRDLLFHISFQCLMGTGRSEPDAIALLGGRPPEVRAAWIETVARMLGV